MMKRDDFISAGTDVNDYLRNHPEIPPEIVCAIQRLKDGCLELIRIPAWIRKHYDSEGIDDDGVWMCDEP